MTDFRPEPHWTAAVQKGADWIARKRKSGVRRDDHAGLFPAGFSAEHLGPNDYYYWDDYWGIAGLRSAANLSEAWGFPEKKSQFLREAEDFKKTLDASIRAIPQRRRKGGIPASPHRRMDSGAVGSLVGDYPLQLTAPGDPQMMATAEYLMANCFHDGAFFQDMIHSGINCYLTLNLAQTLLRANDGRYRKLIGRVADLASPTGQWPEAIHPFTNGGCMGDGQHGWAAAEWIFMIRNLFVREEGDRSIFGSGIFPQWIATGETIRFGPALTFDGPLSISLKRKKDGVTVTLEAEKDLASAGVEIRVPGHRPRSVSRYNETYFLEAFET
jgi:hypothetical protein